MLASLCQVDQDRGQVGVVENRAWPAAAELLLSTLFLVLPSVVSVVFCAVSAKTSPATGRVVLSMIHTTCR